MKLRLAKTGPAVDVPTFLGVVLLVDIALATLCLCAPLLTFHGRFPSSWGPYAISGFGLWVIVTDVSAGRLEPAGLTWRRRLGFVAMAAVLWRGGPVGEPWLQAVLILYLGLVWTALVVGGRTLSRAIATATGEDKPE